MPAGVAGCRATTKAEGADEPGSRVAKCACAKSAHTPQRFQRHSRKLTTFDNYRIGVLRAKGKLGHLDSRVFRFTYELSNPFATAGRFDVGAFLATNSISCTEPFEKPRTDLLLIS